MDQQRLRRYSKAANALAHMDGDELRALVDRVPSNGWGASQVAVVGDDRVFVKRVPVTALEYERQFSTRNLHRLPLYYQYGVGSAGFGVWRELVTHLTTTAWVLDGSCAGFPLLLHHRLMPVAAPATVDPNSWIPGGDYVKYWNGSKRIGSYIQQRAAATYELWLVLEWIPHTLHPWLREAANQLRAGEVVDELVGTVSFLRSRGIVHFDAHYGNVVTDGSSVFLTDYGLANDAAFALSTGEREFLARHQHYDYGEVVYSVAAVLLGMLMELEAEQRASLVRRYVPELDRADQATVIDAFVRNIDDVVDEGTLGVSPEYGTLVARYRDVILFVNAFFCAMRANRRKNTPFEDDVLRGLLLDAGVAL